MSNRTIYDALRQAGMTQEGACGLMGNMMAESTMKSNIVQRGMTTYSDDMYTSMVDNGWLTFEDSIGYGLCQWTYYTRKRALLQYAKSKGVSVGDEAMQVQFCIRELTEDYHMVMQVLMTSHDLYECAKIVCEKYECPAVNNIDARYKYAHLFFNEFCGSGALTEEHHKQEQEQQGEQPAFPPDPSVMVLQMVMNYNGYWGKPDGYKTNEFFVALRQFVDDMEKC